MINNKDYLGDSIMDQSRHYFLYGYNGDERKEFLKSLCLNHKVTLDKSKEMGIYIYDKGLPDFSNDRSKYDKIILNILNREYLDLLMVSSLINNTVEQIDDKILNIRSEELLDRFNALFIRKNSKQVETFYEIKQVIEEAKNIYYDEYVKYTASCNSHDFFDGLRISNISANAFVRYFKKMINNNSYIIMMFDQQEPYTIDMQKAINNYVSYRINMDISIKVACEPEEWKTYYNSDGVLAESVHDYGVIELDNSYNEYLKKIKEKRKI